MPKPKGRASKDEAGSLRKGSAKDEPTDHDRTFEGPGEVGSSRGRGSKSAPGTWRGESVEDQLAESEEVGPQPVETQGVGEEVVTKPRTVSVARSARGRPPKTKSAPTLPRSPASAPTSKLLSIACDVTVFLCLFGLIVYLASRTDAGDQSSPSLGISEDDPSPGINDVVDWIKENGPWGPKQVSKAEEGVDTVNTAQALEEVSLPAAPGCVCSQCSVCADTTICQKAFGCGFATDRELYPCFLAPYMSKVPSVQKEMHQLLDSCHGFMVEHPWWFLLVLSFAAAKIMETILLSTKVALDYALKHARRLRQMMQDAAVSDEDDVDQKTERASQVAAADLLLVPTSSKEKKEAEPELTTVSK